VAVTRAQARVVDKPRTVDRAVTVHLLNVGSERLLDRTESVLESIDQCLKGGQHA
jgi:hypothetical protein